MKKIVRLTESELKNIVEKSVTRAINEGVIDESWKDVRDTAVAGVIGGSALAIGAGTGNLDKEADRKEKTYQADPATKKEFGKELKGKKTASWPGTNNADSTKTSKVNVSDSRISHAVMESIKKLMNDEL